MPTPAELAAIPTTPGSTVTATLAWSGRRRTWTLNRSGRWQDDHGSYVSPTELRAVQVTHDAGATASTAPGGTVTAYDALGHTARLTLTGTVHQDATGLYIDTPTGKWRLHHDDTVQISDGPHPASPV